MRVAIDCCPDQKAQKRLNAIHLLLCGASFELALAHNAVSERCLQKWIKTFNERGIDGITYKPRSGRPRVLPPESVRQQIIPLIDEPQKAGQDHWTAVKLCGYLRDEKALELSYSTLVRYLHEHDYARRIPRPMPEPPDREQWQNQREAFANELLELLEAPHTRVFFGDEAGFEGDPRPRQRWVKRGSRPTQGYYGGHIRQNVVGAVEPATGQLVSLIVPHNDTKVFQAFLDTMAREVPDEEKDVWLVLDNASWHKSKSLNWHHIKPRFLPPYSPDFNPIERLWQHLKSHYLAGFLTKSGLELADKLEASIRSLLSTPETLQSVCNTHSP
ncbi:IS630 family transposase [Roseibacillus ishigakijimensis]|uniref:IS630 family transposase n=1 Tax=Roseibacillus ishigakijimensis TaxID=454146 RepID=A0A934RPT2_9BACT|nr:IS630 family transposase [Roseibacillus ishigakijimensis]MBK1833622.1 IS630 family transposase [Roseibacillus ishigakijimensis]